MSRLLELERAFDNLIPTLLPYLIFAPGEFRQPLAEKIRALYTTLLDDDDARFDELVAQINSYIDNRATFNRLTEDNITSFEARFVSYATRLADHDKKLAELTRAVKSIPSLRNRIRTTQGRLKRLNEQVQAMFRVGITKDEFNEVCKKFRRINE